MIGVRSQKVESLPLTISFFSHSIPSRANRQFSFPSLTILWRKGGRNSRRVPNRCCCCCGFCLLLLELLPPELDDSSTHRMTNEPQSCSYSCSPLTPRNAIDIRHTRAWNKRNSVHVDNDRHSDDEVRALYDAIVTFNSVLFFWIIIQ